MSSALPQLLRLRSEIAGGDALPCFDHAAEPQRRVQAERDLGLHVGELLLDELVGGERAAELLALEHVVARAVPAEFGGAHGAPGDAVAREVEAAERPGEAAALRQQVLLGHHGAVEHDLAGDRGAQRQLALDLRRGNPLVPRSTMKPRILPSSLAQTTATSAIGALVIQVLAPLRRKPPATFSARVAIEPGSEPWSGSVRPKQPMNSPLASFGRYLRRCASLP